MANSAKQVVSIGADISQFQAAAQTFAKTLNTLKDQTISFGQGMQKINKDGVEVVHIMQGLTSEGERVYVTFRKVNDTFETSSATVSRTAKTFQTLSNTMKEVLAQQGSSAVTKLQEAFKLDNANPQQIASYQAAISKIINSFREGKISIEQFNRILGEIQKDPTKIISDLTKAEDSLAKSIRDVAKASKDASDAEAKRVNEAKAKAQQKIDASSAEKTVRSQVSTEGLDIGKLNQFEIALQRVKVALETGKISFARFQELFEKVKVNPKSIIPDLNEQEQKVVASLRVITGGLKETRNASDRLSEAFSISFSGIIRLLEALTIKKFASALIGEFERSIGAAKEFSIKIAEVRTISQQANISTEEWASGINKLSAQFGNSRTDIAEAAYQNLSNQVVKGKDNFELLRTELEFSKAAVVSTAVSANLFTAAMNSFRIPTEQANDVASKLFKTIELGRIRGDQIANTFGRVGAVANAAGVSFEETLAALTTLTRQGITAQDAMTLLTNVLTQIIQPSSKLNDLLKEQTGVSGQAATAQEGFIGILRILTEENNKNSNALAGTTNNIRTLRGEIGLTGQSFNQFESDLKEITNGTGNYKVAVKEVQNSIGTKFQKQIEQLKIGLQETFGTPILENIVRFGDLVGGDQGIAGGLSKLGSVLKFSVLAVGGYYSTIGLVNGVTITWTNLTKLQTVANFGLAGSLQAVKGGILSAFTSINTFLAANPFIAITAGFTIGYLAMEKFQDYLKKTSADVSVLSKAFEENSASRNKYIKEITDVENKSLSETVNNTKQTYDDKYKAILKYSGDVVKLADNTKKAVIENNKSVVEELQISAKTYIDRLHQNIDDINKEATKAKTLKDESKKISEDLGKRGSDAIFNERLKNAFSPDASTDQIFPNQKLSLVKNRITELTTFARVEAKKGTEESIKESRRYYDEVENLEKQKFELENSQRKAQFENRVAKGEEQPTFIDANGQQRFVFISQTAQLEARINALTKERLAVEEQIRKNQEDTRQKKLAAAEQEKTKTNELQQLIKEVSEYQTKIFDKEGNIKPEFLKNPAGIEKDFQEKIDRIKNLAGPDAQKNDLKFFLDLNNQKVGFVKQVQVAINSLEAESAQERLVNQKKNTEATLKNAETQIKGFNKAIQDNSNDLKIFLKSTAQGVLNLAEKDRPIFDKPSKSLIELQKSLEVADEASKVFESNRIPQNAKIYADAMQNLTVKIEAFAQANKRLIPNQKLPGDNQTIEFRIDQARKKSEQLVGDTNKKENAGQIFEDTVKKSENLEAAIKKIPDKINEFGPASKSARDLIRENFKGIENDAEKLALKLGDIAKQLKELGIKGPINKGNPIVAGPGINDAQGEMFGGIVKQYFSSGGMVGRHRHHYDTGGWVGMHPRGSDTEPIMAAKDEFVVNADSAKKWAPLLQKINSKDYSGNDAKSNIANIGDININMHGGPTDEISVRKIAQGLRRELKRRTVTLD